MNTTIYYDQLSQPQPRDTNKQETFIKCSYCSGTKETFRLIEAALKESREKGWKRSIVWDSCCLDQPEQRRFVALLSEYSPFERLEYGSLAPRPLFLYLLKLAMQSGARFEHLTLEIGSTCDGDHEIYSKLLQLPYSYELTINIPGFWFERAKLIQDSIESLVRYPKSIMVQRCHDSGNWNGWNDVPVIGDMIHSELPTTPDQFLRSRIDYEVSKQLVIFRPLEKRVLLLLAYMNPLPPSFGGTPIREFFESVYFDVHLLQLVFSYIPIFKR